VYYLFQLRLMMFTALLSFLLTVYLFISGHWEDSKSLSPTQFSIRLSVQREWGIADLYGFHLVIIRFGGVLRMRNYWRS